VLGLAVAFFFLLVAPLTFVIIRSVTGPMIRISDSLREGSQQVAAASGQVSGASQALAEGAAEQAASIEETSSSLEEMSAMIRQNADNAAETEKIVIGAKTDIAEANQSMAELTSSMTEMASASAEIQKIIKTIDEIAFQTNLLALNAAVEAARAGEAGAGFAVVAEEVRNLAMRSAEAAKNTAELIESTVGKVTTGTRLVAKTNEAFVKVTSGADKINKLVTEIAAASGEQAQGIAQINKAVGLMDKVVQSNAASAEESASASEQMNAQAIQMKALVEEMTRLLIQGKQSVSSKRPPSPRSIQPAADGHLPQVKSAPPAKIGSIEKKEVRPDQVIPLDDDFEDF
jgi:methyl-accepting chemotaxis protein